MRLCNSGVMAFRVDDLLGVLSRIGNKNAKGEFYLTDAVEIARAGGARAAVITCSEDDVLGVNSREQLAVAEAIFQKRARLAVMREGATLIAPETVWLSYDTKIGRDVIIEPNVFFGPGVTVEDGAEIKANCHFERARIGQNARVGPFARLRPGAVLGIQSARRQLRRGEEFDARRRRQGQPPVVHRRRHGGRGRQHRRRHHLLQLRRLH